MCVESLEDVGVLRVEKRRQNGPWAGIRPPWAARGGGKRCASVVSLTTRLLETERALAAFDTHSGARPPCLLGPRSVCELVCSFVPEAARTQEECGGSAVS